MRGLIWYYSYDNYYVYANDWCTMDKCFPYYKRMCYRQPFLHYIQPAKRNIELSEGYRKILEVLVREISWIFLNLIEIRRNTYY